MNGSGCKTCPVKDCRTAVYRGSLCAVQREHLGLGDPKTNADRIRAMSDEEMAEFLYTEFLDEEGSKSRIKEWLKQPAEE